MQHSPLLICAHLCAPAPGALLCKSCGVNLQQQQNISMVARDDQHKHKPAQCARRVHAIARHLMDNAPTLPIATASCDSNGSTSTTTHVKPTHASVTGQPSSYARVHGQVSTDPVQWRRISSIGQYTLQEVLYDKGEGIAKVCHMPLTSLFFRALVHRSPSTGPTSATHSRHVPVRLLDDDARGADTTNSGRDVQVPGRCETRPCGGGCGAHGCGRPCILQRRGPERAGAGLWDSFMLVLQEPMWHRGGMSGRMAWLGSMCSTCRCRSAGCPSPWWPWWLAMRWGGGTSFTWCATLRYAEKRWKGVVGC